MEGRFPQVIDVVIRGLDRDIGFIIYDIGLMLFIYWGWEKNIMTHCALLIYE